MLCPYCLKKKAASKDHVFPAFMGGKSTIKACKECNSQFGASFEAAVYKDLIPFYVILGRCGLDSPRPVKWKNAIIDESTGLGYDLDDNWQTELSRSYIESDNSEVMKGFFSPKNAKKLINSASKKGLKVKTDNIQKKIKIPVLDFNFQIGSAIKRLALKMSVAIARHAGIEGDILNENSRSYLLGLQTDEAPVRVSYMIYDSVEHLNKPLSHFVFIEGNQTTCMCYGVVQLFGSIQLYTKLNSQYVGQSFSEFALLDSVERREKFNNIPNLLRLPESPRMITSVEAESGRQRWLDKLNYQVNDVYGENMAIFKGRTINAL